MIQAHFTDLSRPVEVYGPWQHDRGQQLQITGITGLTSITQVHFAKWNAAKAEIRAGTVVEDVLTVAVPDIMLETPSDIWAYVYITDGDSGNTRCAVKIGLSEHSRPAPDDTITPDDISLADALTAQLNALIATVEGVNNDAADSAAEAEVLRDQTQTLKTQTQTLHDDTVEKIGTEIPPLVGGKIPPEYIPLLLIHNIVTISDESELTDLTLDQVQQHDVAQIVETDAGTGEPTITASYQLIGEDPSVRNNWARVAVQYAAVADYAALAGNAYNASKIGGVSVQDVTQDFYDALVAAGAVDSNTYYFVG